ncbi:MAG: exo-alpha-sialidase [Candidatus Aminicenantes bacterium]|nr:MAG: exo-alpha-sialidase [Candidatus Aminicenantes bacterium]
MKHLLIAMAAVVVLLLPAFAQEEEVSEEEARRIRSRYPSAWEVKIPEGTKLAALAKRYHRRVRGIPEGDPQDKGSYPVWYRAYLRDQFPGLPTQGKYQYPRVAAQILEWMIAHPNFEVPPPAGTRRASREMAPSRTMSAGANINITNLNERNSESFIAVDYSNPQFLIAGANNISGSGRQRQFWSSDGGVTWSSTELPLVPGSAFHADPAVAWTTDGTAWAATLGINRTETSIKVQVYKSTDRGATWSFVKTVSTGNSNDKELMWIDTHSTSPYKDNIYVAWDVTGRGMRFVRSTDKGATWSAVTNLSGDSAIGAHLASGPSGELYVAWPDVTSQEIRVRKSTDGGATFGPTKKIVTTNGSYDISIPAMCYRKVLIYVSIGVDRSNSPRKGWVYAAWMDRNGSDPDPGCAGVDSASNTNIYFSRSTDEGNTWSAPTVIHTNPEKTDQFNQWMDVDPDKGEIHVIFYDTRDDPGRKKAHVYYIRSEDGGNTWVNETRVTTAFSDETASPADLGNQYGDYNGLVAYRSIAHPVWTDRRDGVPGDKEQIFTARIGPVNLTTLTLQPSTIKHNSPGKTSEITATLKDQNGAPVTGVIVNFSSDNPNIAAVTPTSGVTSAAGTVNAAVKGLSKGKTDIEAKSQNQTAKTHVEVPTVSFWGLLILSLVIILILKSRRRESRCGTQDARE